MAEFYAEHAGKAEVVCGENGFLVDDERAMADAVWSLDRIEPSRARASALARYDVGVVADGYLRAYRAAMARPPLRRRSRVRPSRPPSPGTQKAIA